MTESLSLSLSLRPSVSGFQVFRIKIGGEEAKTSTLIYTRNIRVKTWVVQPLLVRSFLFYSPFSLSLSLSIPGCLKECAHSVARRLLFSDAMTRRARSPSPLSLSLSLLLFLLLLLDAGFPRDARGDQASSSTSSTSSSSSPPRAGRKETRKKAARVGVARWRHSKFRRKY